MKIERLNLMAKVGFVDQHLDKIDKLECIEKEMLKKYRDVILYFGYKHRINSDSAAQNV